MRNRVALIFILALTVPLIAGCGTKFAKLLSSGALEDPIAGATKTTCKTLAVSEAPVAAKVAPVVDQVSQVCEGGDTSGIVAALELAPDVMGKLFPDVKKQLDAIGICAAAPTSDACKATWLASYPAALCSAVAGCAAGIGG